MKQIALIIALLITMCAKCDEIIELDLKPYPYFQDTLSLKELNTVLSYPDTASEMTIRSVLKKPEIAGIYATYAGYLAISNAHGQIWFPRKHQRPLIYIVITEQLSPSVMIENTLHHWEFEQGTPAVMYKIAKEQDTHSGLWYWNTEQVTLPEDNIIPLEAIVLFTKPKYVYVPEGVTIAYDRPNIVLPDIYIKAGAKLYGTSLYVLDIKQFFGKAGILFKTMDGNFAELLVPHPGY